MAKRGLCKRFIEGRFLELFGAPFQEGEGKLLLPILSQFLDLGLRVPKSLVEFVLICHLLLGKLLYPGLDAEGVGSKYLPILLEILRVGLPRVHQDVWKWFPIQDRSYLV